MSRGPNYTVVPNDWSNLEYIINDLSRIINEDTAFTDYLLKDGSRPLTANWDVGTFNITALKFISDIAVGTSPYTCTSTTLNTNLNADLLDDQHSSYYASAAGYVPYTGATNDVNLGDNILTFATGSDGIVLPYQVPIYFDGSTENIYIQSGGNESNDLEFWTNGEERLRISQNGDFRLIHTPISTGFGAILSVSSINTSDKTFTFPNNSGTLALTSDIGGLETDPLSLHLNQASPQTFTNLGGGTGLMKVTAGLLGLDTNTYYKSGDNPTFANITDSGLTITRIPYASTAGLLIDSSNLTFDGTNLTCLGTVGIGQTPVTSQIIIVNETNDAFAGGLSLAVTNSATTGTGKTVFSGLSFNTLWKANGTGIIGRASTSYGVNGIVSLMSPDSSSGNTFSTNSYGSLATLSITSGASSTGNAYVTNASGYAASITIATGTGATAGNAYITTLKIFNAISASKSGSATIGTIYAFYDAGQTVATTANWGLAINTQSYINANLRVGSTVAPTVPLDVTGAGLFSTTLGVIGILTCTVAPIISTLTAGRVVFAGTSKELVDDSDLTFVTDTLISTYFQIGTAPTANSSGTVAIVAKDTSLLTNNAGWLPIKDNTGTIRYIPYWN